MPITPTTAEETPMTSPLTDAQLDEIEARHKAATPGPWGVYESGSMIDIAADLKETGCGYRARREICRLEDEPLDNDPTHREWTAEEDWAQVQADAEFIAHAPADVSALLAEIRRLRAQLEDQADDEFVEQSADTFTGTRPCGHDDYHDPHDWADRPDVWCPGISYADDEPASA